jgi:DNA-binding MarR family transcriptional regulator
MGGQQDDAVDRAEIAARLAVAVGRINRRIRPATDGLSHGLVSALSTVMRCGPLRSGDLARLEVVAAPTMTRAIGELVARGLVTRTQDPDDGRSFFIEVTNAGVDAVMHAREERAEKVSLLLDGLGDGDVASIAAALDALEATALSNQAAPRA